MAAEHQESPDERFYFLEQQEVVVEDFKALGFILDIGGGGEGVIGQLKGQQVVAIDPNRRELEEAAPGPLKIVMDARDLQFLDSSFAVATSFFTLMYIQAEEHQRVFEEVFRVLEPGGKFLLWDAALPPRLDKEKDFVAFYLTITLPGGRVETGYGTRWPEQSTNLAYYKGIAEGVGFSPTSQEENGRLFYLEIQKP
jgi:ubiquinone/menaquinone biosynthesis C-methylase UbiE